MANDKDNELLSSLTDEERAALGEEGVGDDLTPVVDVDDSDGTVDPPSDQQPVDGQARTPAIELEAATEIAPPLRAQAPDNANELFDSLSQQQEALAVKFDDGDITAKEYREEMDKLAAQREEIRWSQRKAELSAEMLDNAKREAWAKEVNDFMTSGPGAAIAKSNAQMIAFDNIVRQVTADPQNVALSDRAQLHKAYRLYSEDVKRTYGVDLNNGRAPTPPEKALAAERPARAVVPTLANVPASEPENLDQGRFTALDRLASTDPIAFEKAISRMTEAERAQFEAVA